MSWSDDDDRDDCNDDDGNENGSTGVAVNIASASAVVCSEMSSGFGGEKELPSDTCALLLLPTASPPP